MAKIMGYAPRIVSGIGQEVPHRMPQHMGVNLKRKLRDSTSTLHHPQEPGGIDRSASLGDEHVVRSPLQWPQGAQLRTSKVMYALDTALDPIDVQATML